MAPKLSERVKKPKTHKGKRALQEKEPKLIENTKSVMLIRGGRTSETVTQALKDVYLLKKPNAVMFQRKNILRPFDDQTSLEFFSQKNDASLFMFGSHSKKRPNNLVIGRLYDGQILDMFELGIDKMTPLFQFKTDKCTSGTKPCLMFSGDPFETEAEYRRLKNLLIDFWRGPRVENVRLQGLEHVIQCTAVEDKIFFRSYKVNLKKSGTRTPRVEVTEMGPSYDFTLRRSRLASDDLYKTAIKQPKALKPKKVKNISHDVFGTKTGRIHMQKQDLNKLQTRKVKALKRTADKTDDNNKTKRKKTKV